MKKIYNLSIELEWGDPLMIQGEWYEGDDYWLYDINNYLCYFILTYTSKAIGQSSRISQRFPTFIFSKNDVIRIKKNIYKESLRQHFYDDAIVFDYRDINEQNDLDFQNANFLNPDTLIFFNSENELLFIVLINLESYDFHLENEKDYIKLTELSCSIRRKFWDIYCLSQIHRYDSTLKEYESAIAKGKGLLNDSNLPVKHKKYIKNCINEWKENAAEYS